MQTLSSNELAILLDDMESVKNDVSIRQVFSDGFLVSLPHIHCNGLNPLGSLFGKLSEKGFENAVCTTMLDPNQL